MITQCGLTVFSDRLLKNLSGGYQQRVGIAQSIIHSPKLVILDEPTTGLDPIQIQEIRNLIISIAKECTVVLSTHILSEAQAMCDHIIMMKDGEIVFNDSSEAFNNYIKLESVIVKMLNPPSVDVLRSIPYIQKVNEDNNEFELIMTDREVNIEDFISLAVHNGWRIVSAVPKQLKMDSIFTIINEGRF